MDKYELAICKIYGQCKQQSKDKNISFTDSLLQVCEKNLRKSNYLRTGKLEPYTNFTKNGEE